MHFWFIVKYVQQKCLLFILSVSIYAVPSVCHVLVSLRKMDEMHGSISKNIMN